MAVTDYKLVNINLVEKDTDTAVIIHMAGINQNIPIPGSQMYPSSAHF
jgi:hypothetical protein